MLLVDPISSGVGASIESYAKDHGVPVIDYDRLTLGGDRAYYVSFDNVEVGKLIGQGMVECLSAWNVKNPQILVMRGAPTDNNATLFAQGYMSVLKPDFEFEEVRQCRRTGGNMGSGDRAHHVRAAVHRPSQHQRRRDAE